MKWLGISIVVLLVVGLVGYIAMVILSQKQPDNLGLQSGMLSVCPDSPNCVCSESHTRSDPQHFIQAIAGSEASWDKLKRIALEQGGNIQTERGDYMHITFSTAVFRYVDDVEFRFDRVENLIHMRSASRIGRTDFGVNRKRIEALKKAMRNTHEH